MLIQPGAWLASKNSTTPCQANAGNLKRGSGHRANFMQGADVSELLAKIATNCIGKWTFATCLAKVTAEELCGAPKLIVNINDAKSRLSALVAQAEAGEVIEITRNDKIVARIVPVSPLTPRSRPTSGCAQQAIERAVHDGQSVRIYDKEASNGKSSRRRQQWQSAAVEFGAHCPPLVACNIEALE